MENSRLYDLIHEAEKPNNFEQQELKALVDKHPYFQAIIFLYLKSLYDNTPDLFQTELTRLSIFVNDRRALFYYIMSEDFARFFKKTGKTKIKQDRTEFLLNAFFDLKENKDENIGLEYTISHSSLASNNYFSYIESFDKKSNEENQEQASDIPLKHQNIIDSFIEKSQENGGIRIQFDKEKADEPTQPLREEEQEDELTDDIFFTETLARIYVKQKKYEKAYKIIKHLSLNYPKKNIYFADQLSFLEKLIINSKYKK